MNATTKKYYRLTFIEPVLGTTPNNPDIADEFIMSKAPDAMKREEEIEALGADAVIEKGKTVFPREANIPFIWDYQIKGFMKDSCGMLARIKGSESSKIRAYKKVIDGLIFPEPRKILLHLPEPMGDCQRPLRAQTMQGERVTLANSEEAPAGTWMAFGVEFYDASHVALMEEWLDYGQQRGIGQWRNSGKGRFVWEEMTGPTAQRQMIADNTAL